MFSKKLLPVWRGLLAVMLSLVIVASLGYGIADTWRGQIDTALGTQSYETDDSNATYKSGVTNDELIEEMKAFSKREGQEGVVLMKNTNSALPMTVSTTSAPVTVSLLGVATDANGASGGWGAPKDPASNGLKLALKRANYSVNGTMENIYSSLKATKKYGSGGTPGDYVDTYNVKEAPISAYETDGGAASDWKDNAKSTYAIALFTRGGDSNGEGNTFKPGTLYDNGTATGRNPLAFTDNEKAVIELAKELGDKVIVVIQGSCTMEVDELKKDADVHALVLAGIPNTSYQWDGIIEVLNGTVNATGRLADTYAVNSVSSPAMMNFGGDYYSDYETVSDFTDTRWPGQNVGNTIAGSFGGSATYNGGYYIVEAEGIYTGYNYYETRYYDSVKNQGNAKGSAGVYASANNEWNYDSEVSYTFGHGESYIPYTQTITSVTVEDKVDGVVTAQIALKNNGSKSGLLTAQLYVSQPYTQYDKDNLVEKSAIMFLNSAKKEVANGATETVTITVPTKYLASYDYTRAKTYVMDGGKYYFTAANGAHEAVNNVLAAEGVTTVGGNADNVKVWENGAETACDTTTYSVSESGAKITNVADNADINYYLSDADKITHLTRKDWQGSYPKDYGKIKSGSGYSLASSPKKDEWLKELSNRQYDIKTDEPLTGAEFNGIQGTNWSMITDEAAKNIQDPFWNKLANAITAEEAVGAVAHGGNQTDELSILNPVVRQSDGPAGFSSVRGTSETVSGSINSPSLLGNSFNPALALEWGEVLGKIGLNTQQYHIWGIGLNYHRSPYNGRNNEYLSEDPMLTNRLGTQFIIGSNKYGLVNGPKHIGFNDQEHNRSGICVYMNEQKLRQTDLRGFQGAYEEGKANAMMTAFNRIGAINASHHVGMIKGIFRTEWDFKGLISTDMMNNAYYFNPEGCIMATVTMMADFAPNDSNLSNGTNGVDKTWGYLSPEVIKNDRTLVAAARECMKYQFYAFANSAVRNITTTRVTPWWEATVIAVIAVTAVLSVAAAGMWIASSVLSKKEA